MKSNATNSFSRAREILRERFPVLSDADLEFGPGQEDQFVRHLQDRTGESRESIMMLLRSAGVNLASPWSTPGSIPAVGRNETTADIDHSRGSGIPDDTSRSGGRSI